MKMGEAETYTISLNIEPEHSLEEELVIFFKKHNIGIGAVISALGLLGKAQLCLPGTGRILNLAGPIELLNASGVIRKENSDVRINVNIIVGKGGKVFAGKLSSECIAMEPEGATVFLLVSREHLLPYAGKLG
jgi:predicted DNA-binding protein with PD1-like motif